MKEDQLDPELREGEYIRWQGRTGAFSLLEPLARRTILGKWLCTLVAGGVLLALAGREDAGVGPAAAIAIVLGTAALLAAPVLEWWALRGQHYWITNERAIAMTREHRICSMELLSFWERLLEKQGGKCAGLRVILGDSFGPEKRKARR